MTNERFQQILIGAAVVLVAGLWLFYTNIYQPKSTAINRMKTELRGIEDEIKSAQAEEAAPNQVVVKNGVKDEKALNSELENLVAKIPTVQEIPYLLNNFFLKVGSNSGVDYKLIEPQGLRSKGNYMELPINVSFQADYSDFNGYLQQLKELPSTIRIDILAIARAPDASKLKIDMSLTAFVMPDQAGKTISQIDFGSSYSDPFMLSAPIGKDIMTPSKKKTSSGLRLEGFWRGQNTLAFINGQSLKVGDKINGYELMTIGKNSVTLSKKGIKITLKLEGLQ